MQRPGIWVSKRWREHEELDLLGVQVVAAENDKGGDREDIGRIRRSSRELKKGEK